MAATMVSLVCESFLRRPAAVLMAVLLFAASSAAGAFEIIGNVRDSAGVGIADADVWCWRDHETLQTRTDPGGFYRFADAGEGIVEVVVRKDGYAVGGAEVSLLGQRTADIVLGEPVTLTLHVVSAASVPVSGASVRLLIVNDTYGIAVTDLAEKGFPRLRSDADGLLAIPGLPKGSHVGIVVYHPDFAETRLPYLAVEEKQQPVKLNPGVAVRGRVTNGEGKPVDRARVSVFRVGPSGLREYAERLTDRDGFYTAVVVPGEYNIVARHPDYASPGASPLTIAAADTERIADLTVGAPHFLVGSIVGPDGTPGMGIRVRYLIDGRFYGEWRTRDDGSFQMTVPAGEGALRVVPPPGYATEVWGDVLVKLDEVQRADVGVVKMKLLPAAEGVVTDAQGQPQGGVLLSSLNMDPAVWAITDEQGRFHIQLSSVPEDGKVRFRAEHGLRFQRKDFEVDGRAPVAQTVALEEFEPDLSQPPAKQGGNDLSDLLYTEAPKPVVDKWFNSEPFTLDQCRGKVVVLTLWGGFDTIGPSRDRMFELCALDALYRDAKDLVFLAIHDNGSEEGEIEQFIKGYGIQFPVARDVEAFTTFARYETRIIPQTVLIDKKGQVRFYQVDGRLLELIKSLRREG